MHCLPLLPYAGPLPGCIHAYPRALSRPVAGLPCALHRLVLGLRPVASLVSSAIASGWYQYSLCTFSVSCAVSLSWFLFHSLASLTVVSVLRDRFGLLCPCVKVALATLGSSFYPSHLPHRGPAGKPCFMVVTFIKYMILLNNPTSIIGYVQDYPRL